MYCTENLNNFLDGIPASTLLEWFLIFVGIIGGISGAMIKFYNLAQKWRKLKNDKEANRMITENNQKEIIAINTKIDTLVKTLSDYIEHDKKDKQAMLRNDIQEIYNNALKNRYIVSDDKKNFNYLYTRYRDNDGNSYIVDTVEPFIRELPVFASSQDAESYYEEHGTYR